MMLSEAKQKLYHSIVAFLKEESSVSEYSNDTCESLEVARQCLESAFNVSADTTPETSLISLFQKNSQQYTPSVKEPTPEEKAMAENLKTQGNACMAVENFEEAIVCYTKAIELHPKNSVYFCNRAAAYSRLNNHDECIKDCEGAISIDPKYSKAYGRMGLAYSSRGNHVKAVEAYKKAISLDPDNTNFKENLSIAEAQLRESSNVTNNLFGALGGSGVNAGGIDLNGLMSNPMMQSMAQRLMSDPNMQNTVSSMMQNMFGGIGNTANAGASTEAPPTDTSGNSASMDNLIRMGQQIAQQMQQSNPELVSTLRQQMHNVEDGDGSQLPNDESSEH